MQWTFIREPDLLPGQEAAIRELLVLAFPHQADFFAQHSFWGSPPDYRLVGHTAAGQLVAHLDFGCRLVLVGEAPVPVAGIGAVAVHSEWQGQHLGVAMFAALHAFLVQSIPVDFGFLECREDRVGFYEKAGLTRVHQAVHSLDPEVGLWLTRHAPVMILPVRKRLEEWPPGNVIYLQGMSW